MFPPPTQLTENTRPLGHYLWASGRRERGYDVSKKVWRMCMVYQVSTITLFHPTSSPQTPTPLCYCTMAWQIQDQAKVAWLMPSLLLVFASIAPNSLAIFINLFHRFSHVFRSSEPLPPFRLLHPWEIQESTSPHCDESGFNYSICLAVPSPPQKLKNDNLGICTMSSRISNTAKFRNDNLTCEAQTTWVQTLLCHGELASIHICEIIPLFSN